MRNEMEEIVDVPTERKPSDSVVSYHEVKKQQREAAEREINEKALIVLKKAIKLYEKNYPKSDKGIEYAEDKITVMKDPSFDKLTEKQALGLRKVLQYYKFENRDFAEIPSIGRAIINVNKFIPNISAIERASQIDEEIVRLQQQKKAVLSQGLLIKKPNVEVKPKTFTCQWCLQEFPTRTEIIEHVRTCRNPNDPREEDDLEEDTTPERTWKCNFCNQEFDERLDLIEHAKTCILKCPKCGKEYKVQKYYDEHVKKCKGKK